MVYKPLYERFDVSRPDGNRLDVEFVREGFFGAGGLA